MAKKKRKRIYTVSPRRRRYPNLAAYIMATGEPQMDIAHDVGISQGEISKIIRGLKVPRPALARKLSERCRVPIESFFREYVIR